MVKKRNESDEALMRVVVGIISGIILEVWKALIVLLAIVHWFIVVFTSKRKKGLSDFSEYWNTEKYKYYRYMTFETNTRPFPFTDMERFRKFEK